MTNAIPWRELASYNISDISVSLFLFIQDIYE